MAVSELGLLISVGLLALFSISDAASKNVATTASTPNPIIEIPCQDNATFHGTCAEVNGKMAGDGRCYFFGKDSSKWGDGFSNCAKKGGQFAQIHTTKEFNLVKSMVKPLTWIALRRSFYEQGHGCAITRNTTFWYDSDFDNPLANATKLAAENGPMSLKQQANATTCDKQQPINPKAPSTCITTDGTDWADHLCACTNAHHILCQYTSHSQKYNKTASVCIDEPPIEEFKANAPDECATRCSRAIWCRSFNFVEDLTQECDTSCQLFAWSIEEECPNCPQTRPNYEKDTMCYHWNYVW